MSAAVCVCANVCDGYTWLFQRVRLKRKSQNKIYSVLVVPSQILLLNRYFLLKNFLLIVSANVQRAEAPAMREVHGLVLVS